MLLRPVPMVQEPFDCVVARRVSRDCLVSFEGRRYSVPFASVDATMRRNAAIAASRIARGRASLTCSIRSFSALGRKLCVRPWGWGL